MLPRAANKKESLNMRKYLISEQGSFYKANLHCHSTLSDGKLSPEEIKDLYKSLGYSIVAYTDHDILIPHDDLNDEEFLALHGFEAEITEPNPPLTFPHLKSCHLCFIGIDPDNIIQPMWHRRWYLFGNSVNYRDQVKFDENEPDYAREYSGEKISEMMRIGREKGFFVTYNHPTWSLENYSNYMGYHGMHSMEILNGSCNAAGWNDHNDHTYDDILRGGERIYCIGADDNHNSADPSSRFYDSGWAWTMIKAESLDYRAITKALTDGNFYASEGPKITALWYEDGIVHIECPEADRIILSSDMRYIRSKNGENGGTVDFADFNLGEECTYFRITVIDKNGKCAYTNAYFLDELKA